MGVLGWLALIVGILVVAIVVFVVVQRNRRAGGVIATRPRRRGR